MTASRADKNRMKRERVFMRHVKQARREQLRHLTQGYWIVAGVVLILALLLLALRSMSV